jgi:glutathione peroxidase
MSSVFDFVVKDIRDKEVSLSQYKGKVLLVVNTASKCGFTPQFAGLEKLYSTYKDRGLEVIGFPCNQFGKQELDGQEEIYSFCTKNFGVTFPMMHEIEVNGGNALPLYGYLKKEKPGILGLQAIKWNFEKFLVDRDGKVILILIHYRL